MRYYTYCSVPCFFPQHCGPWWEGTASCAGQAGMPLENWGLFEVLLNMIPLGFHLQPRIQFGVKAISVTWAVVINVREGASQPVKTLTLSSWEASSSRAHCTAEVPINCDPRPGQAMERVNMERSRWGISPDSDMSSPTVLPTSWNLGN